jgi:redox-sensitive bicupin YhaK (pirin superfamily)
MSSTAAPTFAVQRAAERAAFDHGWLKTHHSFSFADYYDPKNQNWGALRVFNDDTVQPAKGFGTHPHRDMEIVTYVLEGELEHRDSMGHHGVVHPGGVQYMSAGRGLTHSEFNHSADHPVHFVQMWVIPRSAGEEPRYGQQEFAIAERTNRWLTIASGDAGVDAPIALRQDATLRVARLENATLDHPFDPARYGFAFVASGDVSANTGSGELVVWDAIG